MSDPIFVDTNVFVYRFDATDPVKQLRAEQWLDFLWASHLGRLSSQVQHELYTTLTRKLGMGLHDARSIVSALQSWEPVTADFEVVQLAWQLEDSYQLSWWDALIVAAAEAAGARTLLSEDLQSGTRYGSVLVVDPFRKSPPSAGVHGPETDLYGR